MIPSDSFITIKKEMGGNHYYISIEDLLEMFNLWDIRAGKFIELKDIQIESWDGEKRVFNNILGIKKTKSPVLLIEHTNKNSLSTLKVGKDCKLLIDNKFQNIKEGQILSTSGYYNIIDISPIGTDYVYSLKVENNNCYFADNILIQGLE